MENFSVSDHEGPLTDEVEAFLNEQEHLTVRRHGDTVGGQHRLQAAEP